MTLKLGSCHSKSIEESKSLTPDEIANLSPLYRIEKVAVLRF